MARRDSRDRSTERATSLHSSGGAVTIRIQFPNEPAQPVNYGSVARGRYRPTKPRVSKWLGSLPLSQLAIARGVRRRRCTTHGVLGAPARRSRFGALNCRASLNARFRSKSDIGFGGKASCNRRLCKLPDALTIGFSPAVNDWVSAASLYRLSDLR